MQEDIFTYSPLTYVGVESIRDLSILVVGLQNFRKKKKKILPHASIFAHSLENSRVKKKRSLITFDRNPFEEVSNDTPRRTNLVLSSPRPRTLGKHGAIFVAMHMSRMHVFPDPISRARVYLRLRIFPPMERGLGVS